MKRIYAVIEFDDSSTFDPLRDDHLDEVAEDLLTIADSVAAVTVYPSFGELAEAETEAAG